VLSVGGDHGRLSWRHTLPLLQGINLRMPVNTRQPSAFTQGIDPHGSGAHRAAHAASAGRRGCDGASGRYNTLPWQLQHRQSDEGARRGGGERHSRPVSPLVFVLAPLDDASWRVSQGDSLRSHVRLVVLATPRPCTSHRSPRRPSSTIAHVKRRGLR